MTKFDTQAFLDDLTTQLKTLATTEWSDCKSAAIQDGIAFLQQSRADIQNWTLKAATGDLTKDELQWLVKGKMDVAELHALTQAGLAAVRVQKFREAVVGIVVGSIFKAATTAI